MVHQAGAEPGVLHPVARTADVQVDLVISPQGGDFGTFREIVRICPAELQRDGMFRRIEFQKPLGIAVQNGPGGHHLGVEQGRRRNLAQEITVVTVRSVHHRRDGKAPVEGRTAKIEYRLIFGQGCHSVVPRL